MDPNYTIRFIITISPHHQNYHQSHLSIIKNWKNSLSIYVVKSDSVMKAKVYHPEMYIVIICIPNTDYHNTI